MRSRNSMTVHEGYLQRVLADGARRFRYRSGVGRLLGLPDGAYMDFAPDLAPGFAFPHPVWKSNVISRLPDGAFGPVPFEPVLFQPGPVERVTQEAGRMEPEPMDPAQSDAGRPPVDKRTGSLPAETSASWMAGLSGGRPLDNDRQPRPESRPDGRGTPEHARRDRGAKPLVDNKSGRSALILPGSTERRTSHANASAIGSSGPYPLSPSTFPSGAFDDVGHAWRPAVLPGGHPAHGEEQPEGTFQGKPASDASGRFLPSTMLAPPDVPRGFEPPRPPVLGPAESAVVQPAAALHCTPAGQEWDFAPAQARFLPDLMIANQSPVRAEIGLSAEPARRDGALAEPSHATANAGRGSSGRPVRGVSRPDPSHVRPAEAAASYADEQDLTVLSPRQPVPQVLEVPTMGGDSRNDNPAFWERRHLRRWQTGLLR